MRDSLGSTTRDMINLSSSLRLPWIRMVHTAEIIAPSASAETALARASSDLMDAGATYVTRVDPTTLRFNRDAFSLGHSWIIWLTRGQLRAVRNGDRLTVTAEGSLIPLVAMGVGGCLAFTMLGMPIALSIGIYALFEVMNGLGAFLGLRSLARRILQEVARGAA